MASPPDGPGTPSGADPNPRTARSTRRRTHRSRVRAAIAAAAVLVVVLGAAGAWLLLRDDAKAAPKKRAAAPTTTTTTVAPAKPAPAVTATQTAAQVTAYQDAVETSPAVTKLSDKTEYNVPRTYLVTDQTSHPGWLNVLLPIRPNGASGWIKASDVTMGTSDYEI